MPFRFALKARAGVGGFHGGGQAGDGRFCNIAGERDAAALLGFFNRHRRLFFGGQRQKR